MGSVKDPIERTASSSGPSSRASCALGRLWSSAPLATPNPTGHGLRGQGLPFVAVMGESFSIERRKLMRFLGAKVVLTNRPTKDLGC